MKFKSLVITLYCSLFIFSIIVPAIAKTEKKIQGESESKNIRNKEYGYKQFSPSLINIWWKKKGVVNIGGYATDVYVMFKPNGIISYIFQNSNRKIYRDNTYNYSNNILLEENPKSGKSILSNIKWISNDEFVITIISDSIHPERNGSKIWYSRHRQLNNASKPLPFINEDTIRIIREQDNLIRRNPIVLPPRK